MRYTTQQGNLQYQKLWTRDVRRHCHPSSSKGIRSIFPQTGERGPRCPCMYRQFWETSEDTPTLSFPPIVVLLSRINGCQLGIRKQEREEKNCYSQVLCLCEITNCYLQHHRFVSKTDETICIHTDTDLVSTAACWSAVLPSWLMCHSCPDRIPSSSAEKQLQTRKLVKQWQCNNRKKARADCQSIYVHVKKR